MAENQALPETVKVSDAAKALGRTEETIRIWCAVGTLPAVKVGRFWVIKRSTLDSILSGEIEVVQ